MPKAKKKTFDTSWLTAASEKKYRTPLQIVKGYLDWQAIGVDEQESPNKKLIEIYDLLCHYFSKENVHKFLYKVYSVSEFKDLTNIQRWAIIRFCQPILLKNFRQTEIYDLINQVIFGEDE